MKRSMWGISVLFFMVLVAFGQANNQGNKTAPTSVKTTADSQSQAASSSSSNPVINENGSKDNRQLLQAIPGTLTTAIPGLAPPEEGWHQLFINSYKTPDATSAEICWDEIERMAKGKKFSKKRGYVIVGGGKQSACKSVHILSWNPLLEGPKFSGIAAEVGLMGEREEPVDSIFARALLMARGKAANVNIELYGCAAQYHETPISLTTSRTKGFGLTSGGAMKQDNGMVSGAVGWSSGQSATGMMSQTEVHVICPNMTADGPFEWAPPVKTGQPENKPEAQTAPVQQVPPLAAALAEVKEKVVAPAVTTYVDSCADMPGDFVITFGWDSDDIREEVPEKPGSKKMIKTHNAARIDKFLAWMQSHKDCKFQLEGYACVLGSVEHDLYIAHKRSVAVMQQIFLIGKFTDKDFDIVNVSYGKNAKGKKGDWHDRKVIAVVRGKTSDWDWHDDR